MFETILIQPLANGLILFYKLLGGNLGVAIIGFSIFLRFALNPLTKPYMKSMQKMKELAPQLEKLKRKYKIYIFRRNQTGCFSYSFYSFQITRTNTYTCCFNSTIFV